jgi:hypothetical protein
MRFDQACRPIDTLKEAFFIKDMNHGLDDRKVKLKSDQPESKSDRTD